METKYAVVSKGKILFESDDLDFIIKTKDELSRRRTGRTTRMIFQALGDPASEVAIVSWNRHQTRYLMDIVGGMLKNLGFDYSSNTAEGTIVNFDKTYYFVTEDYLRSKDCKLHNRSIPKYLDEK